MTDASQYLTGNERRDGVIVTQSGLQYEVLESGDGAQPTRSSQVVTHYRGTFTSGAEFDSSYSRNEPLTFPVTGVIAGWTEALLLMHVGDKWRLHVPHHLGYGENDYGPIPGGSVLVFEIELLEVK